MIPVEYTKAVTLGIAGKCVCALALVAAGAALFGMRPSTKPPVITPVERIVPEEAEESDPAMDVWMIATNLSTWDAEVKPTTPPVTGDQEAGQQPVAPAGPTLTYLGSIQQRHGDESRLHALMVFNGRQMLLSAGESFENLEIVNVEPDKVLASVAGVRRVVEKLKRTGPLLGVASASPAAPGTINPSANASVMSPEQILEERQAGLITPPTAFGARAVNGDSPGAPGRNPGGRPAGRTGGNPRAQPITTGGAEGTTTTVPPGNTSDDGDASQVNSQGSDGDR